MMGNRTLQVEIGTLSWAERKPMEDGRRTSLVLLSLLLLVGLISALGPLSRLASGDAGTGGLAGEALPAESAPQPMRYMIIVTGGELLSGAYPDSHTYFLTRTLHPLGLRCVGSMCVDDKQADLKEALSFATGKSALVIVTGGLGPTDNDITREALSDFTQIPLKEHPDVLGELARRFRVSPDQLRPNLRRQTQVPTRGRYLPNPNGTAVGLIFEPDPRLRGDKLAPAKAGAVIAALPGPPRELQAMVSDELVPYIRQRFGTSASGGPGCSLTLRFVGIGQSQIDQTLKEHAPIAPDITLSSQFQGSRVDFTFSLPADTPQDRARLSKLKQDIMKHLSEYVYADDETSLEQHVVKLLQARGATLALAEAGSGGSLAAALSSADGARQVLVGAYVAPTTEKLRRMLRVPDPPVADWKSSTTRPATPPAATSRWHGGKAAPAASSQRIEQLATAAARSPLSRGQACPCEGRGQWAVAVGEVRQDESGTAYVEVAFKLPGGQLENQQVRLRGTGELARSELSTQLLDQLRRRLR